MRQHDTLGEASGAGTPEDDDEGFFEFDGVGDASPGELLGGDGVDVGFEGCQAPFSGCGVENENAGQG